MKVNNRFYEIDALRGLAALAVVIYHYSTRYDEIFGHQKSDYLGLERGYLGVHLFFIISGFVIFMTVKKTKSVSDFAKKRAIRLYPPYIVAVIITYLLVSWHGLEGRETSFFEGVLNLTMFQGFIPGIRHVDGAYWSLTVELTFYILIGILLYFSLIKRVIILSFFWLLMSAGVQTLNLIASENIVSKVLTYYAAADYSYLFIAGIMFYLIRERPEVKYYAVLISCLLYCYAFNDLLDSVIITLFFIVFFFVIKGKFGWLNITPLKFLGAISYSFYLVHQNIGYIIIDTIEKWGLVHEVYLIIPLLVTLLIATFLTYYVEKPAISYLNKQLKKSNQKKETRAPVSEII